MILVEIKPTKNILGSKFGSNGAKSGPKLTFLPIFSSLVHYFSFKFFKSLQDDGLEQLSRKKLGALKFARN